MMPEYDARLPIEMMEQRRQEAIKRILANEHPNQVLRDQVIASKVIRYLPPGQREQVQSVIMNPSTGVGRLVAAGIAGIAAPLIIRAFAGQGSALSNTMAGMSIPLAAIGGSMLYDKFDTPTFSRPEFYPSMPVERKDVP